MYRYRQRYGKLYLLKYEVIRTTPAGKWIKSGNMYPVKEKFVKNVGRKRFAYETKEDALTNFIKRTERHIMFMECNISSAKEALAKAVVIKGGNN